MNNMITSANRKLALAAGLILTVGSLTASETITQYTWPFPTDLNPAPVGAATATVAPGELSSGWLADVPMLTGGTGGYWDLGRNGTVTLRFTQPLKGPIKVKVAQWWDGGVYGGFATVIVPGATSAGSTADINGLGSVGGWVVDETTWSPSESAPVNTISIQAGATGCVIDSVTVESADQPVALPALSIRVQGERVVLSWPEAAGTTVLESAAELSSSAAWEAVAGDVQVSEGSCSISLPKEAGARFYRLKQP